MNTPNGDVTTTSTAGKGTLITRNLTLKSGQGSMDLNFAGDKAAGNVNMGGQDKPVSIDLGGPLFANAAGAKQSTLMPASWPRATAPPTGTLTCKSKR